jgi:transcriptional regulator with XRE-family HTH domain
MVTNSLAAQRKKNHRRIRSLLILQGKRVKDIAVRAGVSLPTASETLLGKNRSLRIRKATADVLGLEITDIWPDETRHLENTATAEGTAR